MNKSVCIIRSNPVRPDSRVEKEAYSLKKNGYDVHILAWDRDSDHKPEREAVSVMDMEIPITRLGYKASFGEGFKNIIPYLKFQFAVRRFLRKNRFDVVHACDFDTAFFSQGVVKQKKEKFVFDIFDFIACDPKNLLQKIVKKLQLCIIDRSDATIICTEERVKQLEGSNPKKVVVIHNTPMNEQLNVQTLKSEKTEKIKVSYVGILQDYRLLHEIASFFAKHPEMEWHVGGFGKYDEFFKSAAENNSNIIYYGRMSYEATLALENSCDINLAIYDPSIDNHKFAAPNKFYESLMLGKPVIMVKGTGMSNVVLENDLGAVIDYSEEGFAEGIKELVSKREKWPQISEKMKSIYLNDYNWKTMEARLISLYNEL